jgi:D-alanyl-D-alanine carboxypeptidase (penicillin-binding protein 5/6)
MKKLLVCLLLITMMPLPIYAANPELAPKAKAAILIEENSGEIIYEKASHTKLAPASMTKIMTMLLIIEEIEKGKLTWNEEVKASAEASGMGGTQIYLETGEMMKVSDLFKGIAIASANDASVVLAERISGTEAAFVERMNERAKEIGLKDTFFKNSHGLDEEGHYSTAYDIAMLARELLKHEIVLKYTSIYEDYLRQGTEKKVWLVNTNKLLRLYKGVDGLKTGFTDNAKSCLTATAKRNNMRLIAIVMGEPDTTNRNDEAMRMLDYGFNQYEIQSVLFKSSNLGKVEILKGQQKYVEIMPMEEVAILNKKGEAKKENITYDIQINKLVAPVKTGEKIGILIIKENGKVIRKVAITVKEDVNKATIFSLYFRHLRDVLSGDMNF